MPSLGLIAARTPTELVYEIYEPAHTYRDYEANEREAEARTVSRGRISLNAIQALPRMPELKPKDYVTSELIWIPESQQWVGFHRCDHRPWPQHERMEEYHGPFLIIGQPAPSEEEQKSFAMRKNLRIGADWLGPEPVIERVSNLYREL